ncbi:MAG: peptidoglycan DD-metalloendopeptidase family protein [candidate division Zixibacteria bacterium]|nr:peptidoglycan DD-metalloendopeptidase family protein [candidate division Zixibacteria bacterium]
MRWSLLRLLLLMVSLGVFATTLAAIPWPVLAGDTYHAIGNSYGEYQNYGGSPYFHPGIDILAPAGTPVYAVKSGYVKAVLTTAAELHWRVAIGDSAGAAECDGWLYAHLDPNSIIVNEGDWVEQGQYLGELVYWPTSGFHHLHFAKIHRSGVIWSSDWTFVGNPLNELEGITDPDAPVFESVRATQQFAFCRNKTADYFPEGVPVSGDVDIIGRVYDVINIPAWKVTPNLMEYSIVGDSSVPWTTSFCFTGFLDWENNVSVVFQRDTICKSYGDYDDRVFYFNLTNTDGDSTIDAADAQYSWKTADFHNGAYTVYARATDRAGNETITSMTVDVANFFALSGNVNTSDGNPDLRGSVVTALSSGDADTTDASGTFALAAVGGGTQTITIARPGYQTLDTMVIMNQARTINVTLEPTYFARGDANRDGAINIGDAVYIVAFIFRDGPSPRPLAAGDINANGAINIGDAVYLISYLFREGPPPPPSV